MADETHNPHNPERIEPTFDLNPSTDRTANERTVDDMMASLDSAMNETAPSSSVEEELRAEIATLKDQLLRSLAEVENVRRRVEREKQDTTKYAVANFAKAVLPVADNLERALASASEEARAANESLKNLCIGLDMTQNELRTALERNGIKLIDAVGKRLDPNLHQAMFEIEDASVPASTVLQVIQPGYTIHDRLLRPAMVGVSKGGPKDMVPGAPAPANENPANSGAANAYAKTEHAGDGSKKVDTEL